MIQIEHDDGEKKPAATSLQVIGMEQDLEFETVQSSQSFAPGFYWTATKVCPNVAPAGDTLLLMDVIEFEGNVHSVRLRNHPRSGTGHKDVMVDVFLDCFAPCADAESIRQREQQAVMKEVMDLQSELMATQADPQLMIEAVRADVEKTLGQEERDEKAQSGWKGKEVADRQADMAKLHRRAARRSECKANPLVAPKIAMASEVGNLIGAGINESGVAELAKMAGRQAVIAGAQASWLQSKTKQIATTLEKLAPYIAERSAVALARVSGAVKMSERIRRGIESLDLYTGKGVDVFEIRAGAAALTSEPLTLIQGKRYAEEEFAAWADVDASFDYRNKQQFFDALTTNDELLDQIMPAQRCVVSVAMTRNVKEYGNSVEAMFSNMKNLLVFLLVRNGKNVHVVYSSSPSHEGAKRLFPTMDELQAPFRGWDGSKVSIRDIEFGEASKQFDNIALAYRRFLILLCGLDHRLQLMGTFYPPEKQMSFMTAEFQEQYFRFVADEESGWLIGEQLPDLDTWMQSKNDMVQSGSRVHLLNDSGGVTANSPELKRRNSLRATPAQFETPFVAQRELGRIYLTLDAKERDYGYRDRLATAQVKCYLSGEENSQSDSTWWLCVDGITLDEVRRYRFSRIYRGMGVGYLRLFRRLESYLELEMKAQAESSAYLVASAIEHGGLSRELAESALGAAVRNWRASRRGVALPGIGDKAGLSEVLTLMVPEGHVTDSVERMLSVYLAATGVTPLLLTRSGKAKLMLYVEASPEDRAPYPDVLTWGWVKRITLEAGKTKLLEGSSTLLWLTKVLPASEVEIRRWDGLDAWMNELTEPLPIRKYAGVLTLLAGSLEWGSTLRAGRLSGIEPGLFRRVSDSVARAHSLVKGTVPTVVIAVPVAAFSKDGRKIEMTYMQARAEIVLFTYGTVEQRAEVSRKFADHFLHRAEAAKHLAVPLEWRMTHSSETLTLSHDTAVRGYVPGSEGLPAWAKRDIKVNDAGKGFFTADKEHRKAGGPTLKSKSVALSLDRAFGQLTGAVPGSLRSHFYKDARRRSNDSGSWLWNHSTNRNETEADMKARRKAKRVAVLKERYVHSYKSALSALVWPPAKNRSIANALFVGPLIKPVVKAVEDTI